jgi:hypothetical protein
MAELPSQCVSKSAVARFEGGTFDRTQAVDRRLASANMRSGLAAAAIAVGMLGLTFFAAILYIG